MSAIRFEAELIMIGTSTLLRVPSEASAMLPSRGMVMAHGTINEFPFHTSLEPDGMGSHWFNVSQALRTATGAEVGDAVSLTITPTKDWPDPELPDDLAAALASNPLVQNLWLDITPIARWDWVRWIGATKNPETRRKRIATACSMFEAGKRRPCCFNRSLCTEPSVSKNGKLLVPAKDLPHITT